MGKTSFDSQNAWKARNYDRVTILVKKGEKAKLKEKATAIGGIDYSVSHLILDCVNSQYPGLLTPLLDESKKKKEPKETASDPQE